MAMERAAPEQSIRVILCRVVTIAVSNHGRFKFIPYLRTLSPLKLEQLSHSDVRNHRALKIHGN